MWKTPALFLGRKKKKSREEERRRKLTLVESTLPFFYLRATTRYPIQALNIAALVVEVVNGPPGEGGHPELGLVAGIL